MKKYKTARNAVNVYGQIQSRDRFYVSDINEIVNNAWHINCKDFEVKQR